MQHFFRRLDGYGWMVWECRYCGFQVVECNEALFLKEGPESNVIVENTLFISEGRGIRGIRTPPCSKSPAKLGGGYE